MSIIYYKSIISSVIFFIAPNVYNIPSAVGDKTTPAYTISGRTKEPVDERVKNPAPGQYNNVDPENYKTHAPSYTISGRVNVPKDDKIPGPGVYSPEKVCIKIIFHNIFKQYMLYPLYY